MLIHLLNTSITQNYYQAHGSNASWEWLATIAPCVVILRRLATDIHGVLGSKQGTRHAAPDLTEDIEKLMESLDEREVYRLVLGRIFDDDDVPAPDAVTEGFQALCFGSSTPLKDYNKQFLAFQRRRRIRPLVGTSDTVGSNPRSTRSGISTTVQGKPTECFLLS